MLHFILSIYVVCLRMQMKIPTIIQALIVHFLLFIYTVLFLFDYLLDHNEKSMKITDNHCTSLSCPISCNVILRLYLFSAFHTIAIILQYTLYMQLCHNINWHSLFALISIIVSCILILLLHNIPWINIKQATTSTFPFILGSISVLFTWYVWYA